MKTSFSEELSNKQRWCADVSSEVSSRSHRCVGQESKRRPDAAGLTSARPLVAQPAGEAVQPQETVRSRSQTKGTGPKRTCGPVRLQAGTLSALEEVAHEKREEPLVLKLQHWSHLLASFVQESSEQPLSVRAL